jgi:hypothetical protein
VNATIIDNVRGTSGSQCSFSSFVATAGLKDSIPLGLGSVLSQRQLLESVRLILSGYRFSFTRTIMRTKPSLLEQSTRREFIGRAGSKVIRE